MQIQFDISVLKRILLVNNYISEEDSLMAEAQSHDAESYIDYLIVHDMINKDILGQAFAEAYKLTYMDLSAHPVIKEQVIKIPETEAREQRVLFVKEKGDTAVVTTDNPQKVNKEALESLLGKKIQLVYSLTEDIENGFLLYEQPLETRFSNIIQEGMRVAPEIVDEIIKEALGFRASDIHFEPHEDEVVVRFRVDGNLRQAGKIAKEQYENILNRLKISSGMRIDSHHMAQDGSLHYESGALRADLRVALAPTVQGEKIVLRVLGSYIKDFTLADIGLSDAQRRMLEAHVRKPFGMVLAVGPTGSGKTTTLYSLLRLLNKPNVNITTIEDPVEYKIPGVNQIPVREQTNLTFGRGLRSIIRQDPNIILVGEIRDSDTAQIAVNAALTGHLLLSSFHSVDAATAIPRLMDMGIEPFLLSSTLEAVVAQRLVRRICPQCRHSVPIQEALAPLGTYSASIGRYFAGTDRIYVGKGCGLCGNTGYKGRIGIFELISITSDLKELILTSPSTQRVAEMAARQGEKTMFDDGIEKVKSGLTTMDEVLRVAERPRMKM